MKNLIFSMLVFAIFSCTKKIDIVKYRRNIKEDFPSKSMTYLMSVPSDYKLKFLVGGHNELEKQFIYTDSSEIYISDFVVSELNYNNIISLGSKISDSRFESIKLKSVVAESLGEVMTADTMTLEGKSANGLYWKDIRMGHISTGYTNVTRGKKPEFDKALASFRKK